MKVEILTICDYATNYGNKLCIIGSSETFHSTQPQSFLSNCFLVYRLRFEVGDDGNHKLKIVVSDEDGKEVKQFSKDNVIAVQRPNGGFIPNLAIIPLNGILIPKYGEFSISLFADNQFLASIPIYSVPAALSE
ncbi:MAG: DUF6941 family protein [Limisphaerales bacterium]